MDFSDVLAALADPGQILTHVPYALLILSMLMNDMGWLRGIAIAAGVTRIVNRAFIHVDPVVVLWEAIFVAVNVIQLGVLVYYRRRHRFSEDEHTLVERMPPDVERHAIRRLFRLSTLKRAEPGTQLTAEGRPVAELMFVTHGVAQVERGGQIIAVCGPGDFIGEMSFVTGAPANATVVVVKPLRYFAFDQQRLQAARAGDSELQRALEGSLARNLAHKLHRTPSAAS